MAGLVPAIHDLLFGSRRTWMPGTSPGMTAEYLAKVAVCYPKYRVKIPRYTFVNLSKSTTGTRSSTWCMVWPTRPNSITGQ
jgi:hypothetical protein